MDTQIKFCGNCRHFKDESTDGKGWCEEQAWVTECSKVCKCHEPNHNGWTELTPDNVDEVYEIPEERIIIGFESCGEIHYQTKTHMRPTLNTLAKSEGYYYYVLPELKLKET